METDFNINSHKKGRDQVTIKRKWCVRKPWEQLISVDVDNGIRQECQLYDCYLSGDYAMIRCQPLLDKGRRREDWHTHTIGKLTRIKGEIVCLFINMEGRASARFRINDTYGRSIASLSYLNNLSHTKVSKVDKVAIYHKRKWYEIGINELYKKGTISVGEDTTIMYGKNTIDVNISIDDMIIVDSHRHMLMEQHRKTRKGIKRNKNKNRS